MTAPALLAALIAGLTTAGLGGAFMSSLRDTIPPSRAARRRCYAPGCRGTRTNPIRGSDFETGNKGGSLSPPTRSNLATRVITAAVVAPLILLLLFWGPVWGFTAFVLAAVGLSANEFFGMSHPEDRVARAIGVMLTLGLSGVIYRFGDDPRALLTLLAVLPIASLLLGLARLGDVRTSGSRMAATTFGPLWLGTLTLLALLRRDKGAEGSGYVLMAIMFAWLADTGGYFAGRFLGRHKLYEP